MTLDSVRDQSYPEIEHILIDGASTDDSIKISETYPHLAKVVSEPDQGTYFAMNKGILLAEGEIVGILNADDFYIHPKVLQHVMSQFENRKLGALYGDLNYVDQKDTRKVIRKWRSGPYNRELFLKGWMPPHPAFFIRKAHYLKYGLYDTDLPISADYELMLRMLYRYEVSCEYLPEVLVAMRVGGKSNNSFKSRWQANRQDRLAWKVNGLKPGPFTLWKKPWSKLEQYF